MARYQITLRCPDTTPGPSDVPGLALPASPTSALELEATITGAAAGAVLRVYDGGVVIATATAGGTGTDVVQLELGEGEHQLSATARVAGHTESPRTPVQLLVVDRTAPVVTLTVVSPSPSRTVQLQVAASGAVAFVVSQDATPPAADDLRWGAAPSALELHGSGERTATPIVHWPESVPAGGTFEIEVEVPQLPWHLYAWARDAAGNVGHASAEVVIAPARTAAPVLGEIAGSAVGEGFWLPVAVPQAAGETPDPEAPFLIIETEGSTFAPLLQVDEGATVEWFWADGTSSAEASPTKAFYGARHRVQRLRVTPWSALRRLNVGYDAGDGGDLSIPLHPAQQVSAIRRLQAASGLEVLAFSGNPMTSLDAHGMPALRTIESFLNHTMKAVDVTGCPNLRRLCLEENECEGVLDLRDSPLLEDLRGSVNSFTEVLFADAVPALWHVCVQAVPGLAQLPYEKFVKVIQLWVDRSGQTGVLPIVNPDMISVLIWDCGFTGVDLSQVKTNGMLTQLNAANCNWSQASVDHVLTNLVRINAQYGQRECILTGNAAPSSAGQAAATTLRSRGWTVTTA